eukprot:g19367.t1
MNGRRSCCNEQPAAAIESWWASGATIPSRQYNILEVDHHLKLAREGFLKCFACGERCPPESVKCHPMLAVHVCPECYGIYHLGTFTVAEDGHEIYCRMCGNGGTIITCDERDAETRKPCPYSFCVDCIERNFGTEEKVHSSNRFKCWVCDDSRMERLRRRIPGYEPNSKSVLTRLITNLKQQTSKVAPAKEFSPKPHPPSGRSKGTSTAAAAAAAAAARAGLPSKRKPKPKRVASCRPPRSSSSSLSMAVASPSPSASAHSTSGESDHRPPPRCRRPRSPPSTERRHGHEEEGKEEESEDIGGFGFEDDYGGSVNGKSDPISGPGGCRLPWGGVGGGAAGQLHGRGRGSSAWSGALSFTAAAAQGGLLLNTTPPPEGPGKGATFLPTCSDDSDEDSSGGSGSRYRSRNSSVPRQQRGRRRGRGRGQWEESSSSGGLSTDTSEEDSEDLSGGGSGSAGRGRGGFRGRGGRVGKAGRAARGRPDVFSWDRRISHGKGAGAGAGAAAGGSHRPTFSIDDLSHGMEEVSIQVCNNEDDEKLPYFRYVTSYVMGGEVQQKLDPDDMVCCDCTDGCRDPTICACLRLRAGKGGTVYQAAADGEDTRAATPGGSVDAAAAGGGGGGGRKKCGARCACNPHKCKNRVVSRGIHLRLQVFRCRRDEQGFDKGWGLRCLDRIPAGSFVACYLGEVLTDRFVDDRGKQTHDDYVFGLDFAECATQKTGHGGASSAGAGTDDWGGLASPFTPPSPLSNGGTAARSCGGGRSPGRFAGGDSGRGRSASLSLSPPLTPQSAPARKKPKRSPRSPLAAASAATVAGAAAAAGGGGGGSGAVSPAQDVLDDSLLVSPENETLEAFMGMTGLDRKRATFFVSGADGVLERAMNHYLDNPAAADCAGGGATAAAADRHESGGVGDDADDEREESDDNENDRHPAAAAAAAGRGATGENIPEGLSGQERQRWIYEHNERERAAFLQEQEAEARLCRAQRPVHPSVTPSGVLAAPLSEGGGGGNSGSTASGGQLTPPDDSPHDTPEQKTVSPPSSPAEVLWQELDDASEARSGAFSSSSFAPTGRALILGGHARSPLRRFGGGGGDGGGDGVDTAAVVEEHPTSANVLPCLATPASPLGLGPAYPPEHSGPTSAGERPITIDRAGNSQAARCTPLPPQRTVATTPNRSNAGVWAAGGGASRGWAIGEEDGPGARRPAQKEGALGGSANENTKGGKGAWLDAEPPSPSPSSTPYSPRSDRSAEMVVDAKTYGNVARFMNHSCDGNLIKKMVFVESHEARMPLVAFFAPECIEAYEELTYDYNYKVGSVEGTRLDCHCGAGENCRGRLL